MHQSSLISTRVDHFGYTGTVKYAGPLLHNVTNKLINPNLLWVGIEWDMLARGNHNGTVSDFTYFTTTNNRKSGSLIKETRITAGIDIIEGYVRKYFKPKEANEILKNKEDIVKCLIEFGKKQEKKLFDNLQSEYDEAAIIKTSKSYKKIEFLGFDKIWSIITNVKKIMHLSLSKMKVSSVGKEGAVGTLFTSLKELNLEYCLISCWDEIGKLTKECPNLESLWLKGNKIEFRDTIETKRKEFEDKFCKQKKEEDNLLDEVTFDNEILEGNGKKEEEKKEIPNDFEKVVFKKLKMLEMGEMGLTFSSVSRVLKAFPFIEELVLSNNNCSDFNQISFTSQSHPNLKALDLSQNGINSSKDFSGFSNLHIEKLNLLSNDLDRLNIGQFFPHLTHLNLVGNNIKDDTIFKDLSTFKNLVSIRLSQNPIKSCHDSIHLRFFLISSCLSLKIVEGSEVTRDERRDAEIYYLGQTFADFFRIFKTDRLTYDYDAYLKWATDNYPNIEFFLKKYGNPHEVEERYLPAPPTGNWDEIREMEKKKRIGNVFIRFELIEGTTCITKPTKKFPMKFDIGYIRTYCKNAMKLRKKTFKLILQDIDGEKELDDNSKKLNELVSGEKVLIKVFVD